jgi:hypothetical protein
VLAFGLATACAPITPPPPPSVLQISANPGLFPSFSPSVTDYVSRCSSSGPVMVSVSAPSGTTVSVDGQPPGSGTFAADVTRDVGQSFTMVVDAGSGPSTYYVRCLPADFPTWTVQTSGPTQAEWYTVAAVNAKYPAIFDANGVPVWWGQPPAPTAFAQVLPNNDFAWITSSGEADEVGLNGALIHTIQPAGSGTDWHDLLQLPNGDYVIAVDTAVPNVNLQAAWGASFPTSATVVDHVIKEIKPDGTVVWSWSAHDHIDVRETDPQWRNAMSGTNYDAYHWNSIEPTPTGYLLSFRHLNAVFSIDGTTGNILWKLGGSATPQSLTVLNDPVFTSGGTFGGQHDARMLADGTVTVHDDGSSQGRPPRAVQYQIDTTTTPPTATLVDALSDPLISSSFCCGSARKLPGGDWVMGWGGTNTATEMTAGTRPFLLQLGSGFLYRTVPVPPGQLDRATLRAGMDAQYASPGATHTTTQPPPRTAPPNQP